jgi:hypothetical protein
MNSSYEKCFQEYNDAIKRLWKPVFENITIPTKKTNVEFKQFCFHVNQDESPIWFFGMNPSLLDSTNEFISQTTPPDKHLIAELEKEQKKMHKEIQYFKRATVFFEEEVIIPELRKPIFHDLYPVRHTNQKEFVKFLKDNPGFCKELDKATKDLIDGIMPEIIVIANAKASELMQKIFFGESEAEKIKLKGKTKCPYKFNGKKTDMIFSSMLSGQRALDTYSRSRLAKEIIETWESRNN